MKGVLLCVAVARNDLVVLQYVTAATRVRSLYASYLRFSSLYFDFAPQGVVGPVELHLLKSKSAWQLKEKHRAKPGRSVSPATLHIYISMIRRPSVVNSPCLLLLLPVPYPAPGSEDGIHSRKMASAGISAAGSSGSGGGGGFAGSLNGVSMILGGEEASRWGKAGGSGAGEQSEPPRLAYLRAKSAATRCGRALL